MPIAFPQFANFDWQLHHQLTIFSKNPIFTLILNGFAQLYVPMAWRYFQTALARQQSRRFYSHLRQAALNQEIAQAAAVVFVWVAVIRRSRQKYRQRAYRYIYLDCGHIAQNLYLAATALGLGCCGIAAIFDDEVNDLVGVDGQEETAIYLATVGNK